jgi:hypothetical protein
MTRIFSLMSLLEIYKCREENIIKMGFRKKECENVDKMSF